MDRFWTGDLPGGGVLRNTGILSAIDDSQSEGITLEAIASKTKVSEYGVRILLESALSTGMCW